VRSSVSCTNSLKIKQMPLYELGGSRSLYEEDHLIPLELGGARVPQRTSGLSRAHRPRSRTRWRRARVTRAKTGI
jgi:hypothetical protein